MLMGIGFIPYARHCELESAYKQSVNCLKKMHKKDKRYCAELIAIALNSVRRKQYLDAVAILSAKVVRIFHTTSSIFETCSVVSVESGTATNCFVLVGKTGGSKVTRYPITSDMRIFVETY